MSADVANRPSPAWGAAAAHLVGIVVLAILFTLGGAYDTDDMPAGMRSLLWLLVSALLVGQTVGLERLFARVLPGGLTGGLTGRLLSGVLAVGLTLVLITVELDLLKQTPLLPKTRDPFVEFLLFLAPLVFTISGFILLLRALAGLGPDRLAGEAEEAIRLIAAQPVIAGFLPAPAGYGEMLDRWPEERIVLVHASDHYLEVETEHRRLFLRGRMRDAVRRLSSTQGVQVHRSWWVALDQIREVARTGRDYMLRTVSGEWIPVGRSRIADLRDRGLL